MLSVAVLRSPVSKETFFWGSGVAHTPHILYSLICCISKPYLLHFQALAPFLWWCCCSSGFLCPFRSLESWTEHQVGFARAVDAQALPCICS